ncbi:MAG: LysM peptidoglycan-binding domain-containing protein [Candidatus Limnocylindrales bacterium]
MDGPITQPTRRTLTPAVLASALFVAACAAIAITFVTSRGGLQMPIAASGSAVALATQGPPAAPTGPLPTTIAPTSSPAPIVTPAPSIGLPPSPSPSPTTAPTPAPTPFDLLFALPPCPDQPGCYEYLIKRGDSLSGVASRYAIPVSTVLALNPEITDPSTIVVGQILYLGRDPFLRLDPCPDTVSCYLYVVRPGDRLSTIAGRFALTVESLLDANPSIDDENTIYSGQVLRLQYPEG